MAEESVDVLVVGAGLAGLSTAMFLAQRGVRVLAVERHHGTAMHPRASGQNWRTMELFRFAGIDDEVLGASARASKSLRITIASSLDGQVYHQLLEDSGELDLDAATPRPMGMAGQDVVEPIMLARAEKFGAHVRFATELATFEPDADAVHARVRTRGTGAVTDVRARYLVAADGGASPIRERLGVPVEGVGTIGHSIGVVFDADLGDHMRPAMTELYYLQNEHFTAAFTNTDTPGRFVFAPDYHPERGQSVDDFTTERLTELIRIATDRPELEPLIRWVGPWEMAARVATEFRRERVLLVGDAAKVTPPTGGMGGNAAIGDGYDVAWKLASVLHGQAGSQLLDTYQDERKPVAEMVVNTSLHNVRHRMVPGLDTSGLPEPVDQPAITLGFRCRSSAVIRADDDPRPVEDPRTPTGRPGFRAPHVPITIAGEVGSTVDLFGQGWVLLSADGAGTWCDAMPRDLGVQLACYVCGTDFADHNGLFSQRYGLAAGGASLVRPDGIVAWRSSHAIPDPASRLREALDQLLSR